MPAELPGSPPRERAPATAGAAELRLRLMLEASPTITWTLDRDLRFTSSVGAGLAALGLKPDEVVGRSLFQYFGTDDPNFLPIAASRRALEGESVTYETAFGGHLFLSRVVPLRAPSGEVVGCLGSSQDVTDLRRTEEALRRRAEFEQLLLSVAGAFVRAPASGLAGEVRKALERLAALLDADRATLYLLSEDGSRAVLHAEWRSGESVPATPAEPLPARDIAGSLERGRSGEVVWIPRLDDLPADARGERALAGTARSLALIPLRSEREPLGFLALASLSREDAWPPDTREALPLFGEILGHALERLRAAALQSALDRIGAAASGAADLVAFLGAVHATVEDLIEAKNFYVALWDEESRLLRFPYFADEFDPTPAPKPLGRGLTEYVIRTGRPLLATPEVFEALLSGGEVELIGAPSLDWIGVPLTSGAGTFGALVVQSYSRETRFGERELSLLTAVGRHVEGAIRRRQAEADLVRSVSLLESTLESTADGILVVASDGRVASFNRRFAQLWDLPADLLAGRDDERLLAAASGKLVDPASFLAKVRELYATPEAESFDILKLRDGRVFERYSVPQRLEGRPVGRVWSFRDMTERFRAEEQIEHQAYHDILTGLPNRRLLSDHLELALAGVERGHGSLAVLYLDIDRFKPVNDSLGHVVGDRLLRAAGERLRASSRAGDTVARMGGDEFVLLLSDLPKEYVAGVAQKILDAIAEPFPVDGHLIYVTTSMGVALAPDDGDDAATLMKNADNALYRAKELGRNNFQFCTPALNAAVRERAAMGSGLRHAIEMDELRLHYQPQVDIETGEVVGLEALVRWQHPDRGLVLPAAFIPVAEDTRLIVPMGHWVLRAACGFGARLHAASGRGVRIGVNLSPRQFVGGALVRSVGEALSGSGFPPALLELEITESVAMSNLELTLATLRQLRALGVSVVLDDFGVGHSSLAYLKSFALDALKIDRSFMAQVPGSPADEALVTAIVEMAKGLSLRVVAEGVEREEQVAFLRSRGCRVAQGFLFSRPLPPDEALAAAVAPPGSLTGSSR